MSQNHRSVGDYWRQVGPAFAREIEGRREPEIERLLLQITAIFAYVLEDLPKKVTKNKNLFGRLESLLSLGFDALRGSLAAQECQSLATAAICGRTLWEAFLKIRFIKDSTSPEIYADRFFRFAIYEKLLRHFSGRIPLPAAEVDTLMTQCSEWVDPKTKRLRDPRSCDWTGDRTTVRKQAVAAGEEYLYETLYGMGSMFVHGSSAIRTLYTVQNSLRAVADPRYVRGQSLLAGGSAVRLLLAYADFFSVDLPSAEISAANAKITELAQSDPPSTR